MSIVYLARGGGLERADLLMDEVGQYFPDGVVIGRWKRLMAEGKGKDTQEPERLANAEDLFLAMLEDTDLVSNRPFGEVEDLSEEKGENPGDDQESSDAKIHLLHLLTLFLERKKILKRMGRVKNPRSQIYKHVGSGVEYEVPVPAIDGEVLVKLGDRLAVLID
ncbi:MAG: hypothetical protein ACFCU4_09945 [Puniceicoccaceae bacterium]